MMRILLSVFFILLYTRAEEILRKEKDILLPTYLQNITAFLYLVNKGKKINFLNSRTFRMSSIKNCSLNYEKLLR